MILTLDSIITIATVVAVISMLAAIALFIHNILKKEHEFQEKEKMTFAQYQDIIQKAHEEATKLLESTSTASEHILSQARNTNENIIENLDKILQNIAQKHIISLNSQAKTLDKEYQDKVVQILNQLDQNSQQITQSIQASFTKQLETHTKSLLKKTTDSEAAIDNKTKELLTQVESEIAEYKKVQLARIDAQVLQVVQKTYQDILQQSIPEDVQKQLILDALEKAKKEGAFTL